MILSHKIALDPTPDQIQYFIKACGTARFAYNWALDQWNTQYKAGQKPNQLKLRRELNAIKRDEFPWMYDVYKTTERVRFKGATKRQTKLYIALTKHYASEIASLGYKSKGTSLIRIN